MPNPIKVFICYKRYLEKTQNGRDFLIDNNKARILSSALEESDRGFFPWMDKKLHSGVEWENEIYRNLRISDVLLVLIGPGTSKSEWVQREIALATALGISVVPLGFDITPSEMDSELKGLSIKHLQAKTTLITEETKKLLVEELSKDLVEAAERTKNQQLDVLKDLLVRLLALQKADVLKDLVTPLLVPQKPAFTKANDNQTARTYKLKLGANTVNLHLASGDLTSFQGIDVLVNSENNYMQMARFFEGHTISSQLRKLGARKQNGKYEDVIQEELDLYFSNRSRPVLDGEVFITSAGGPTSKLSDYNNVQYIFHVAAVEVVDSKTSVNPYIEPAQIRSFTYNCLDKIKKLNQRSGVISQEGTEQWKLQKERADKGQGICTSILFPLFGTGAGGANAKDVIEPMLTGIRQFLSNPRNADLANCLTDIYISAYRQDDLDELTRILNAKFV